MAETEKVESFVENVARDSWRIFAAEPLLYVLASVIVMVMSVVTVGLLAGPMTVGFMNLVLKKQRGEAASAGDVFSGFSSFLSSFVVLLIIMVGVFVGMLLLVIPGLLVALFTCFALQAIALEGKGVFDALGRSVELVKANFLNVIILLLLVSVLHAVGSSVIFGVLLSFPLGLIATVIAYQRVAQPVLPVTLSAQPVG